MSNPFPPIPAGTTGQGLANGAGAPGSFNLNGAAWRVVSNGLNIRSNDPEGTQGWNVTVDGLITVPLNAEPSHYSHSAYVLREDDWVAMYWFRVPEPCDFSIVVNAVSTPTNPQIGTAVNVPFVVSALRVVNEVNEFLSKTISLAIDWGDGTSSTQNVSTSAGQLTTISIAHTYMTRGTYAVSAVGTDSECEDVTGSGSGSVQAVNIRWFCQNGQCNGVDTPDNSGFASEQACIDSGCETVTPPPQTLYERYVCAMRGGVKQCVRILTPDPTQGAANCEEANCTGPTPPTTLYTRYRCNNGACEAFETTDAAAGFASCEEAGCPAPVAVYTRWRCNAQGVCEEFQTSNPLEGFGSCQSAACSGIVEPPIYTRWRCNEAGVCESFQTANPAEGFEDCAHAKCPTNPPPGVCAYLSHPIADLTQQGGGALSFSLSREGNDGWTCTVAHTKDGTAGPTPLFSENFDSWRWTVPRQAGIHQFVATLAKPGCPPQSETLSLSVAATGSGGSGNCRCRCFPGWCHPSGYGVLVRFQAPPPTSANGVFVYAINTTVALLRGETYGAHRPCVNLYLSRGERLASNKPRLLLPIREATTFEVSATEGEILIAEGLCRTRAYGWKRYFRAVAPGPFVEVFYMGDNWSFEGKPTYSLSLR